jgi:hypothetical protein
LRTCKKESRNISLDPKDVKHRTVYAKERTAHLCPYLLSLPVNSFSKGGPIYETTATLLPGGWGGKGYGMWRNF